MRWLLHGPMTSAVADALKRHGHEVRDMPAAGLPPEADVADVLKTAQSLQLDILTTDGRLAAAPFALEYWFHRSIVYLQLEQQAAAHSANDQKPNITRDVEQDDAVDRLFARYKRLTPGRLYTVTESRVKIRQLPGGNR